MLGRSPIKWKQLPHMTIAVDWDGKHQVKQKRLKKAYFYIVCMSIMSFSIHVVAKVISVFR